MGKKYRKNLNKIKSWGLSLDGGEIIVGGEKEKRKEEAKDRKREGKV